MKKFAIALVALLVATTSFSTLSAYAQDEDQTGSVILNGIGDNWFVGAGLGLNLVSDGSYENGGGFGLDIYVGKWITPSVGLRIGYTGTNLKVWSDGITAASPASTYDKSEGAYERKTGYMYLHGDVMFDFANIFLGYKDARFWSPIGYVHGGWIREYCGDYPYEGNDFGAGLGLLNNFRLCDRLNATIDIRGTLIPGRAIEATEYAGIWNFLVGINYDLGKNKWSKVTASTAAVGSSALQSQLDALQKKYDALKAKEVASGSGAKTCGCAVCNHD